MGGKPMVSSARNQFAGTVSGVVRGAVNSEVTLDVGIGLITAMITNGSADFLQLEPGKKAYALIKAPWVILSQDTLKTSARNNFRGTVSTCHAGPVVSEIIVDLGTGGEITAIVTNESVRRLHLQPGAVVNALFKASNVIIAVDA